MPTEEADRPQHRQGDELFRTLVERVPAVVYIDSDAQRPTSVYLSPQIEGLLGHPPTAYVDDPDLWYRQVHPEDAPRVADAWRDARIEGGLFECEYRMLGADGRVVRVHDRAVPFLGQDGRVALWQGVLYDVTERGRRPDDGQAHDQYRALVENLPAVLYLSAPDDDRRTLYVSPHIEAALGYARQEWLDQPDIWMELLHPDDREIALAALDAHNESGEPWSLEYRLIASDGRPVWFRDVAVLVRDEGGHPRYWQGVQLDITELKRVEAELRRARDELERRVQDRTAELEETAELMSLEIGERQQAEARLAEAERRYRLLAENIPAVTYTWGVGSGLSDAYTSPRIESLLGYTPKEWHRDDDFWIERLHPDDRHAVLTATLRSETTGEPFSQEYRYLHKDGHIVWVQDEAVLLSRAADGSPLLFQGVMLDITARKEAEARVRETDRRYRDLAEQVPGIIYTIEVQPSANEFVVTYVGPQIREILGMEPDAWRTGPAWLATVHPDDRERVGEAGARLLESGEPWAIEYRVLHADGSTVWMRDRGRVLEWDATGRPRVLQGLAIDISDERSAIWRATEAQDRYRTLIEQVPAIVYIQAPTVRPGEAHLLYMSPQAAAITGYTAEELMADTGLWQRIVHPEDRDRVLEANVRADRTGGPYDEEYRVVAKDGRTVWLHSRADRVTDEDGRARYWHGVALDVTDRRVAEDNLRTLEQRYEHLAAQTFRRLGLDADAP